MTTVWVLVLLVSNNLLGHTTIATTMFNDPHADGALACEVAAAKAIKLPNVLAAKCTYVEFPQ